MKADRDVAELTQVHLGLLAVEKKRNALRSLRIQYALQVVVQAHLVVVPVDLVDVNVVDVF